MASRFQCSICLDDFTKPKLIDCHHTFCEKCLADHIRNFSLNNQFPCPLCRRDIIVPANGVSGFSSNFYLEDTLVQHSPNPSLTNTQKCEACPGKKQDAAYKCKECRQFMCGGCKGTHDSFSGCAKHTVSTIDEVNLFAPVKPQVPVVEQVYCPKHTQIALEFYCRDCRLSVCYKCSATVHNGHKIEDLDDQIKLEATQEVEKLKHDILLSKRKIDEHLECIAFSKSSLLNSTTAACTQVDKQVEEVCKSVRSLGENLKIEIRRTNQESENVLNKLTSDIKTFSYEVESSLNDAIKILTSDSAVRLVNIIPKLRQTFYETTQVEYLVPERRMVVFKAGSVDPEDLLQVFGNLDYRRVGEFQTRFNVDEVEGEVLGISSQEFTLKNKIQCSVSACKKNKLCFITICTNRQLRNLDGYPQDLVPNIHCAFELELVNLDQRQSMGKQFVQQPDMMDHISHFYSWSDIIEWKTLSNLQAGFIDENRNFMLRMRVLYR